MHYTIRRATPADLARAAHTLALAFDRYPWTRWAIPADGYSVRLEQLQGIYLEHTLAHGLVLVDEDVQGVGAFLPGSAPEPNEATRHRIAELHGDRIGLLMDAETPPQPVGAWSLATLGVRPSAAGQGLGSAIITQGLDEIGGNASAVGLETSDERNVRLYQRHGFETTFSTRIPDGPLVYSMLRSPSTA